MDIFHFNINIHLLPFFFISSVTTIFISFLFFIFFFDLESFFSITYSFDVWFTIHLFLWLTHSTDFREIVPVSRILHFALHIFLKTILGSMKESLHFLWLDYTSIEALKPVMRSVFLIPLLYSAIFSILLRINLLACN